MMGKNHVVVTLASSISMLSVTCAVLPVNTGFDVFGSPVTLDRVVHHLYSDFVVGKSVVLICAWSFLLLVSLCLGTLFPDIDRKTSTLGRYIYLPLEHRTWTHSLFACLLLLPITFVSPLGLVFWIGYFLHLLEDASSAAGVCFFYPIQKYKKYASGAMVVKGHKLKLYYAGKPSEIWLTVTVVLISIVVTWYTGFMCHGFLKFWSVIYG